MTDDINAAINQRLLLLLKEENNHKSKTWTQIVIAAVSVSLTALIAIISAFWIAVVSPLADKIKEVAATAASKELTASEISQLQASSASKELVQQQITHLQESVARIEAQMITRDEFSRWVGKANQSR